jgi:hypothetical protein
MNPKNKEKAIRSASLNNVRMQGQVELSPESVKIQIKKNPAYSEK